MKSKSPKDPLKAARKGSREAEIGMYDHPIAHHRVHQSKKTYNRAKVKAGRSKDDRLFNAFKLMSILLI
jgi:hypothetical protein